MSDSRVLFNGVWKKFHRGASADSLRDLIPAIARGMMGRRRPEGELAPGDFWAIRDLSFEVLPGETLGIIGPNGSGKSTVLKLLTRILAPTRGMCEARGRVGTLIEVSAGFHGDLSGRENVFLQGAIMGMRVQDITRKFEEIVEFSGVADSIDTPVKYYSSGMNARLGFSIAAYLEPDVLIIDEVLSVGDLAFQERAFGRLRDLARSGIPVVIVSHQLERIAELCTDAILLANGEVAARGTARDVIASYVSGIDANRPVSSSEFVQLDDMRRTDEGPVKSGERFTLRIRGTITRDLPGQIEPVALRVRSMETGRIVFASGTRRLGIPLSAPGAFVLEVELQANVAAGSYMVELTAHDMRRDIASGPTVPLQVTDASTFVGFAQMNARMSLLV